MSSEKKTAVIKIGGAMVEQRSLMEDLGAEIAELSSAFHFVIIHGGGGSVTSLSRTLGMEPVFRNGVRLTSPREMDVVDMILSGKMNKDLVRILRTCGLNAVGISGSDGGIFLGRSLGRIDGEITRTGDIDTTNTGLLHLLLESGYLPVVSSTSMDVEGNGLNVNADSVAFALASAMRPDDLVFISDIPGVLKDDRIIHSLTTVEAEAEIQAGVISGGMIPKVESSMNALRHGVKNIIIGTFTAKGSLSDLIDGKSGTLIHEVS